jgi:hypothetical protein
LYMCVEVYVLQYVQIYVSVVCMHVLVLSSVEVYDITSAEIFSNSLRLFLLLRLPLSIA